MTLPDNPKLLSFLNNLFDTNADFAQEHNEGFFAHFKDSQNPNLTILKCSDSRVQMESFDKTPQNGVFAVRNIGNQISTSEGSIDYGIHVLNTPFLLIIGHSGCEAIRLSMIKEKTEFPAINHELGTIKLHTNIIEEAIVENVNTQVTKALAKYQAKIEAGTLTIIGAVYDFKNSFGYGSGKVVLTNINGISDSKLVETAYRSRVKNLHFMS